MLPRGDIEQKCFKNYEIHLYYFFIYCQLFHYPFIFIFLRLSIFILCLTFSLTFINVFCFHQLYFSTSYQTRWKHIFCWKKNKKSKGTTWVLGAKGTLNRNKKPNVWLVPNLSWSTLTCFVRGVSVKSRQAHN